MHNAALPDAAAESPFDPPPFELAHAAATAPVLLLCDHASNRVPAALRDLGLSARELAWHIGWDIGAAEVARELSRLLEATLVLSGVSRLVIDCNRALDNPTSVPAVSDGVPVPGNRHVDPAALAARAARWFHPYHDAIAGQLGRLEGDHATAAIISIHSFTPRMNGHARPWPVGILWDRDPRLPGPLIASLRERGFNVGDNEPYSGKTGAYTIDRHAAAQGRPHVTFEIRQDEIATEAGAKRWAVMLAELLRPLLALPEMRERRAY